MTKALAFDFDGLLVDGLNECVLVSWNGFYNKGVEHFGPEGLEAVPTSFIETFRNHRNFSRHLGHFITPFFVQEPFKNQADFDTVFSRLNSSDVEGFSERVTAYRHAVRQVHYQRWLQYHSFYPGVVELLKETSCPIYIVTGKDAASVDELLQCVGISVAPDRIFGECQDKVSILNNIAKIQNISKSEVYFFDDNVTNARSAHEHGFNAYWATWGYNAPDHWDIAQAAGLPIISLDDFIQMNRAVEIAA